MKVIMVRPGGQGVGIAVSVLLSVWALASREAGPLLGIPLALRMPLLAVASVYCYRFGTRYYRLWATGFREPGTIASVLQSCLSMACATALAATAESPVVSATIALCVLAGLDAQGVSMEASRVANAGKAADDRCPPLQGTRRMPFMVKLRWLREFDDDRCRELVILGVRKRIAQIAHSSTMDHPERSPDGWYWRVGHGYEYRGPERSAEDAALAAEQEIGLLIAADAERAEREMAGEGDAK